MRTYFDHFDFTPTTEGLVAEASDLGWVDWPAAITVKGKVKPINFYRQAPFVDRENEVLWVDYTSPSLPGYRVRVYND